MVRFSDSLIEEVRARNDIVEIVGEAVKLKRAGANYTGLCPFHNEKTASFSVNRAKQMYYCFGCHAGGNVITFLMEYHHMSFPEAMESLAERAGISLPKTEQSESDRIRDERKEQLLTIHKKAAVYYYMLLKSAEGARAMQYLQKRNLSDETIKKWGLGFTGISGKLYEYLKKEGYDDDLLAASGLFHFDEKRGALDKFWNRIMFPIQDARGRVIGFGGRVMGDATPKYLNSPETDIFNKRQHLYGLHYARATRRKYMILCEGYMDVISLHQAGFDNACASLGTALTAQQAQLLRRYTNEVMLLYDADDAGRHAALRAIPLLKEAGLSVRVASLLPYKDPDEFLKDNSPEAMETRFANAQNAFMFEVSELEKAYDLKDPQDATAFQHAVAARLAEMPEELERENYLKAVAAAYQMTEDALRKLVQQVAVSGHDQLRTKPKSLKRMRGEKEDGGSRTERRMISYLVHIPEAFPLVRDEIGVADYEDPLCRQIAGALYPMLEKGAVSEATLITLFTDPEEQRNAAEVLQGLPPADSADMQNRDFTDTYVKLASAAVKRKLKEGSTDSHDVNAFQKLMEKKIKLEDMRKTNQVLQLPFRENDDKGEYA